MSFAEFNIWRRNFRDENKNIEVRFQMNRVGGQKNIVMKQDKRGKVVYRADVTVNMKKERSQWTPSLDQAKKARDEFESKRILPEYKNGKELQKRIRFGNLVKEFLERRTTAPSSAVVIKCQLNTFSHLKDFYTDELSQDMFNCLFKETRKARTTLGYTQVVAQLKALALAMDYKFSIDTDLLNKKAKRMPAKRRTVFDCHFFTNQNLEEFEIAVNDFIAKARDSNIEGYYVLIDMLKFSQITGLRIGEIQGLCWESLSDKEIIVERQAFSSENTIEENNGSVFGPPKHGVIRNVVLPAEAKETLEKYKKYKSEHFVCEGLHLVFLSFFSEKEKIIQ